MEGIRLANTNDISQIMMFINDHWKENHILARDKAFFTYEHQDIDTINYVISLEDNKINGILGFIKYSENNSDIATVLWKTLKSDARPMLGVELLQFLRRQEGYNMVFSPGINKKTIGIYNYLGIYTNHLNQFLIINDNIQDYQILKLKQKIKLIPNNFILNSNYSLSEINESELTFNFDEHDYFVPHKDRAYFSKRYFNHPIYKYKVYAVYKKERLSSLLVTREIVAQNSKILRIMDYLGDERDIVYISSHLYQIVLDHDYEYVDFMCFGFSEDTLTRAGFSKIDLRSNELVAPNYFAPFIQENIQINFMADIKSIEKLRICKADGDQDRPS